MIDLQPIVAALKAAGCPRVLGVLEYAALENAPAQLPAHFVVPIDDQASPSRTNGIIDQRVVVTFQVITVVAAQAALAGRPSDELRQAVLKARRTILGKTFPETVQPAELVNGRLMSARAREAVWGDRFRTAIHERVYP